MFPAKSDRAVNKNWEGTLRDAYTRHASNNLHFWTKAKLSYTYIGLSMQRFWATDANRSEHFARQFSRVSQIFKLMVSTSEKKLNNTNGVVWRQVK